MERSRESHLVLQTRICSSRSPPHTAQKPTRGTAVPLLHPAESLPRSSNGSLSQLCRPLHTASARVAQGSKHWLGSGAPSWLLREKGPVGREDFKPGCIQKPWCFSSPLETAPPCRGPLLPLCSRSRPRSMEPAPARRKPAPVSQGSSRVGLEKKHIRTPSSCWGSQELRGGRRERDTLWPPSDMLYCGHPGTESGGWREVASFRQALHCSLRPRAMPSAEAANESVAALHSVWL